MLDLENKKVLVSGSSNGLGLKIVEKFSENGSIGFGFDILESSLDIKKWNFLKVNVSKEEEIIRGFEEIRKKIGNLDVVVANAGIVPQWRTINSIDNETNIPKAYLSYFLLTVCKNLRSIVF